MEDLLKIAFFSSLFFVNGYQYALSSIDNNTLVEMQRQAQCALDEVLAARSEQEQKEFHEEVAQAIEQLEGKSNLEIYKEIFFSAVSIGDVGLAKVCLTFDTDINMCDRDTGLVALCLALLSGNLEMIKFIGEELQRSCGSEC